MQLIQATASSEEDNGDMLDPKGIAQAYAEAYYE